MKKICFAVALLLPLYALGQPLTPQQHFNQMHQVNPSQQRIQQEMQFNQTQQQGMLRQNVQNQQQYQQQHLQNQIQSNSNRVLQSQPGNALPNPQPLPNVNGGMLNNMDSGQPRMLQH